MINKCTAIIKTFLRDDYFFECYRSLKDAYPKLKVLVADSGYDTEEKTKFIKDNGIEYYKLPFDSGICVGRNFLIEKVKTPYILVGDDDFRLGCATARFRAVRLALDGGLLVVDGRRLREDDARQDQALSAGAGEPDLVSSAHGYQALPSFCFLTRSAMP